MSYVTNLYICYKNLGSNPIGGSQLNAFVEDLVNGAAMAKREKDIKLEEAFYRAIALRYGPTLRITVICSAIGLVAFCLLDNVLSPGVWEKTLPWRAAGAAATALLIPFARSRPSHRRFVLVGLLMLFFGQTSICLALTEIPNGFRVGLAYLQFYMSAVALFSPTRWHSLAFVTPVVLIPNVMMAWGGSILEDFIVINGVMIPFAAVGVIISRVTEASVWRAFKLELQMQVEARHDVLTGCLNRRYITQLATQEVSRSTRHNHVFTVLLMDLDHFKKVNDTYGHAAGDQALKSFAEICRNNVRTSDSVARFGGEEFLVLLPDTDASHAKILAERIRSNTELAMVHSEGISFKITVSIGIAQFAGGSDPFEQIVARADTALYRAKANGRNRVEIETLPAT